MDFDQRALKSSHQLMQLDIQLIHDAAAWNSALAALPAAKLYSHVLQSWEWGDFKHETTGWKPYRFAYRDDGRIVAMASVGVRRVGPLSVAYVSKGPALDYSAALNYGDAALLASVLDHLEGFARSQRAIWLKIDPDVITATGVPGGVPGEADDTPNPIGADVTRLLKSRGWRTSDDQVQFRNTITLDLTLSLDDLLAHMSQNTRRKVRTAEKKGVTIREATLDDLPLLYALYRETGARDGFLIRPAEYYQKEWADLMRAGIAHALIAESEGQAIAHVILFRFGKRCWYFYGASSAQQREKMPNYLLQWAAIQWAKVQGCTVYDFWGAPDVFDESDSMWGVYEFKRGFRGAVTRHIGAWDYVPSPLLYRLYTQVMPQVIATMKRLRR
jgi:peptidoglycan pentaglycine glycine transferase (the first glycine)